MSNLSAAAAALNAPEALVQRSAEARAKATGAPVEDILAAWAGGAPAPAGSSPAGSSPAGSSPAGSSPAASEPADSAPAGAPAEAATAPVESAPEPAPVPGSTAPSPSTSAVTALPAPKTVTPAEALAHPVVVSVPTAGLRERTASHLPRWVAALFILIPAFGLLYFSGNAGADSCVEGGFQLAVDRVTGLVENCDGSAYEGKGGLGGGGAQFLAIGQESYAQCASCHGANGAGAGAFPGLTAVNTVFSSCADHIEWVELGTQGFQSAGRETYGDTAKAVGGSGAVMPAFGSSLTPEQLASVVAYERVAFGGGDAESVLTDCGLVEGADTTDGTGEMEPTSESGETTETTAAIEARLGHTG